MVNYSNSKIYKIVADETTDVYYGSTCQPLADRLSKHRSAYKLFQNGTSSKYYTSFEIVKHPSNQIVLIENFPCSSKEQLHARERYYIESNTCVNKNIPSRNHAEYYQDNKESILNYQLEYYQTNRNKIKEYRQKNRDEIHEKQNKKHLCDCGTEYTQTNKARHERSKKHIDFRKMELLEVCEVFGLTLQEYQTCHQ